MRNTLFRFVSTPINIQIHTRRHNTDSTDTPPPPALGKHVLQIEDEMTYKTGRGRRECTSEWVHCVSKWKLTPIGMLTRFRQILAMS